MLEIQNIFKAFGGLKAIVNFSLRLKEGEILGLIGPNGAGKSTLLNMIDGSLPPSEGRIIFLGEEITRLPSYTRAQKGIARVFQQDILFSNFTVTQNILMGLQLHSQKGFAKEFFQRDSNRAEEIIKAKEILEYTGLIQESGELAKNLPHGKKRLLGLSVAMATGPKLLLLDEPVTGMNTQEMDQMINKISMLRDERHISMIIVEHNLRAIMGVCDRIVVLNFGVKIDDGLPGDVVKNPTVIEAYLGREEDDA